MKARLLHRDGALQLLLCSGRILDVTLHQAHQFLSSYCDPRHYAGDSSWDYDGLTMESFSGTTVAVVNDDSTLTISDSEWFAKILSSNLDCLVTAQQYAELHRKQSAIVRRLCLNGQLSGAVLMGNTWFIPKDTPYPPNSRNRRSNQD